MTGVTISGALTWSAAQDINNQTFTNVDINSGAIDGVTIGASAAPTVTNLGSVATCDINGGAIDGVIIGANSAAALTCTTFTSTGIDDNADATALTISVDEVISLGAAKLTVGATTPSTTQWGALGALVEWTDWTPTLTGGADLSGYDSARFFRLGDICFFEFDASNRNVTTAGTIQITLPFTHANTGSIPAGANINDGAAWVGYTLVAIDANVNYIQVFKTSAAGAWAGTETGVYIRLSGFFEIA